MPPMQISPGSQARPQARQLAESTVRSVQTPPQQVPNDWGPSAHAEVSGRAVQSGGRQLSPAQKVPAGHDPGAVQLAKPPSASRQMAPRHVAPVGQMLPQAPQLVESMVASTQAPPQHEPMCWRSSGQGAVGDAPAQPLKSAHVPRLQNCVLPQALPQVPQWSGSVDGRTQDSLQQRPRSLKPGMSQLIPSLVAAQLVGRQMRPMKQP
jgi:hypothetical protein